MILFIAVLIFITLSALLYALYPYMEQRAKQWHKRRLEKFNPKLDNMFIQIPSKKLLIIDICCPLIAGTVVYYVTKKSLFGLLAALAGLVLVGLIVKRMEALRRARFSGQLVDGLMLLSGSLKAGLSLVQSLEALVEEMPPPISQEFGLLLRENRMGVPLEDCLVKLKNRMSSEDLDMIVTAILVARETGGNLTTIFSNLVISIRERNRLLGRVRALCVQGKLQGRIMMALPIVFAYGVYRFDPNFFTTLLNDPLGKTLIGYAVVSEILGIFFIQRLSKIEI